MKINYLIKILSVFVLIWGQNVLGQNENPSASSAVRFEEYPVDLSTGLPQVTIPIYTMPTRSKDVNIDVSLNYHPSSVSAYSKRSGNCGSGWNLSAGGVLSQSEERFRYTFSFMGFSGKFYTFALADPQANITENKGEKMFMETEYHPTTSAITAYNFYDDKGYRYRFSALDIIHRRINNVPTAENGNFQITEIYDPNNQLLASFTYTSYTVPVKFGTITKNNTLKVLNEITVPGYGKITLSDSRFPVEDEVWFLYDSVTVRDPLNNIVKTAGFFIDAKYDVSSKLYNLNLLEVTQGGSPGSITESHKLYYRPVPSFPPSINLTPTEGTDPWGYYNVTDRWCNFDPINTFTDPVRITGGVLEKMTLPTGGCIIYNYESNTYSYTYGIQNDMVFNPLTNTYSLNQNYYTDLQHPENHHNFYKNVIANLNEEFIITTPTEVYFKFDSDKTCKDYGGGQLVCSYADFTLQNITNPANNKSFGQNYKNEENNCLGQKITLYPGTYKMTVGTFGTNISAIVYKYLPKATVAIKKWWHGGGIRVKSIAYFRYDTPQNYFDLGPTERPPAVKFISYSYNLFNESNRSSGVLGGGSEDYAPIRYRNVTVSGPSDGKTEYSFHTSVDFTPDGQINYAHDYRVGKLKNKKVYDAQNVLLLESDYQYNSIASNANDPSVDLHSMGWMVPSQILNKEYFPEGTLQTKDVLTYDTNRKIKDKTTTTSRSSESLITKYYYHVGNSIYSKNRIGKLDYVEEFLGTNLLSTSKIEYSNVWKNNAGTTINVAYLPQQMKSSKGAGALEIKSKINRYDQYGNVLETEQQNGIKKAFVWGYNNTQVIAEIDNIGYSGIPEALITAAQTASNSSNEASLLTALTNLRNATQLADAFITTYTYKPLVGVLSVTDPRGYKMTYEYDANNRLTEVRDQDGNIITKNTYNTKPQN